MSRKLLMALVPSLAAMFAASAQSQMPDELLTSPLAERWGKPATFMFPKLSPDGSKLLFQSQDPQGLGVALVLDFDSGDLATVGVGTEEAYDLGWCDWGNEDRIVCDMVFAVNADGSEIKQLEIGRNRRPPERSGACGIWAATRAVDMTMDWTPEDPEHVTRYCGRATRINLYTGFTEDVGVGTGRDLRGTLASDGHDFPRLQQHRDIQAPYDRWYFRNEMDDDWTMIHESDPLAFEESLRPVGFANNRDVLFRLGATDGRWGLHVVSLAEEPQHQALYTHPLIDIELVDTMGAFDRVVAAAYLDGTPKRIVVDPLVDEIYKAAAQAFPGHSIEVVDESWDGSAYLLLVREPGRAGEYFRLSFDDGTISPVGSEYPHLDDVQLATTRTVSFNSAEGGTLAGHLTVPNGQEGPFPTVIMSRSLPSRLDVADPHYLVQFLADSGYAVLRLQNRGPERYDGVWAPDRVLLGWERMASDLDDAMRYLVDEGVAESDKMCALGRDYGAFPPLMHGLEYPGKLACIATIGALTTPRSGGSGWALAIGGELNELQREGSPSRRAKEYDVPMLMFHGVYDRIVSHLGQTLELKNALDRANKEYTYIEYEHARHDIERVHYRVDMLTRLGSFLDQHIGDGAVAN